MISPPITSKYGQVIWDVLPSVDLPADVVMRFADPTKAMAITGFEVDVVRNKTDPVTGLETSGRESVPCYDSYNHHYVSAIHGKGAFIKVQRPLPLTHGSEFTVSATEHSHTDQTTGFDSQSFNEHNGNEARQTFHGMPPAGENKQFAVILSQPTTWTFGPMQINTKNPDGSGKRCRGNASGCLLPRSSNAPPGAPWSGLLECPCTTRVVKEFAGHFTKSAGTCSNSTVRNSSECFESATTLLGPNATVLLNSTTSDNDLPAGCQIRLLLRSGESPAYHIQYNDVKKGTSCGAVPTTKMPSRRLFGSNLDDTVVGLTVDVNPGTGNVTITLTTNDTGRHWYAVGLNASTMDQTYAIVVSGNEGIVTERLLGNHNPGKILEVQSLDIVSQHKSSSGLRTTVLRRPLEAASRDHYSFVGQKSTLQFIAAVGSTPTLAQHRVRGTATLSLLAAGAPTCVCRGGVGKINGFPFEPNCMGEPLSDLLKTKNPTCDINLYSGGMACCRGNQILLDKEQVQPGPAMTVYYHWRFYYQVFDANVHRQTYHLEWQFGHIEYDVPKAPLGTPPEEAVHTMTTRFRGIDLMSMGNANAGGKSGGGWDLTNMSRPIELVMMGFHCHSPACLGGELYNADTNELLCRVTPAAGKDENPKDEASYLWLPPCQWGDPASGLAPPPIITGATNLLGIKRASSVVGHYGVMAIFQGRGAYKQEN